ncbi:MAG: glycoside hydrolase family 127 protein [Pirellulales bacterium]
MHVMRRMLFLVALATIVRAAEAAEPVGDYPLQGVPLASVDIEDPFWAPRLETNRRVTIAYDFDKCEQTGRIDNFAKAGGMLSGEFEGISFNDSDVYKVIEGAAYALNVKPDPELDRYLDALIDKIAAAQESDGYLYTARTLRPNDPPNGSGRQRWSHLVSSHELYNVGHLYEAAGAHFRATGKRTLLDVATKNAHLVDRTFGPGKRRDVPGHEEIEIGLVKLYRVTGERRYVDLAKFFLDERGQPHGRKLYGPNLQDHQPVTEQRAAVGHAVRAGYLYTAMADVAALTGDSAYVQAIDRLWNDIVFKKMYLTGGIGSRQQGEAFGDAYELPNKTAYNETCAAIAHALFNHRMFLLHGDAKYIDVLERILYNGFLAGVALEGNRFFYSNPLESDGLFKFNQGAATRSPWFGCSCCPVNVVRFFPLIRQFAYATKRVSQDHTGSPPRADNDAVQSSFAADSKGPRLYVNLFVAGSAEVELTNQVVTLRQETNYPWDGKVQIAVIPQREANFDLRVRIPGWAQGRPVPSDLYRYVQTTVEPPRLTVNGKPFDLRIVDGYAVIDRRWQTGDVIGLELPMPVRRVVADARVAADRGRVALERGPLVYCVEGVDHGGHVLDLGLADDMPLTTRFDPQLLGGLMAIRGQAIRPEPDRASAAPAPSAAIPTPINLLAIPYYAWSERGAGEMIVWLRRDKTDSAR